MVEQNGSRPVAVVVGTDDWLRPRVIERLVAGGIKVKDLGRGTASLYGADILVALPALAPRSGDPGRDVGTEAAQITFGAVMAGKIQQFVVVSRVGSDPKSDSSYLAALGDFERRASHASSRLTLIRVTHPFGPPDDAGPLVRSMLQTHEVGTLSFDRHDPAVQPVYVDDIANLVTEAAGGDLGPGLVELGGPATMPLSQFVASAKALGGNSGRAPRALLPGSRRRQSEAIGSLLTHESVASRRLAGPITADPCPVSAIWGEVQVRP